jgi:tetratricopeptide (TPR) repeat protein
MHYNLGVFYSNRKEYSRAIAEFEKAVELVPDDAAAHFNLGYIYAEQLVNRERAIRHFQQYLRYAKHGDKDADWVKRYIVTWQAYENKQPTD